MLTLMLSEYKVGRCTRRCYALQRPLREGEWFYSVVLERGTEYERRDYAAESWPGPPEGALGWWKNRMPTAGEKQLVLAPPGVLIDLLRQMAGTPERAQTRYLLALMLMRRKLLRPLPGAESAVDAATGKPAPLRWEVVADGSHIEVSECEITAAEAEHLQAELNELLYCEVDPAALQPDDSIPPPSPADD